MHLRASPGAAVSPAARSSHPAVAGSVLGLNPFNQPDVEASKVATRKLTSVCERTGKLPPEEPLRMADPKLGAELEAHLAKVRRKPDLLSDEALVFPNRSGGFLLDVYFRNKVFFPLIKEALGRGRHHTDRTTSATPGQACT